MSSAQVAPTGLLQITNCFILQAVRPDGASIFCSMMKMCYKESLWIGHSHRKSSS